MKTQMANNFVNFLKITLNVCLNTARAFLVISSFFIHM